MNSRRVFLKSVGLLGVAGLGGLNAVAQPSVTPSEPKRDREDRAFWLDCLDRIALPVITSLARRQLREKMPVEAANPAERRQFTHLEAWGRLLAGLAPWLAAEQLSAAETIRQANCLALVRECMDAATNPQSADFLNFNHGGQALVDSAFMAQGILRAPKALWQSLAPRVQGQVVAALKSSRAIATPHGNNWVMFAAMVETALHFMGEKTIDERLERCVDEMLSYYKGDGVYGDGNFFHFDYYNSFVIQPMLLEVLAVLRERSPRYEGTYKKVLKRAQRFAVIQERLIAPDGTFPSLGRSTTYRFGAFQTLAQMSLQRQLPASVQPAQVRCALTTVIRKMIEAPGTFDANGWLQIGFYGHQPSLAEGYISTGSLYLCSTALLPLGLPATDEFWSGAPAKWTSQRLWSGENLPADHAIAES